MPKFLILGRNGSIGSNLLRFYKQAGNTEVFGCDIQESNDDPSYFCIGKEERGFDGLFRKTSFDFCINCSGPADPVFIVLIDTP